jgi:hypothetical protein
LILSWVGRVVLLSGTGVGYVLDEPVPPPAVHQNEG